MVSHSIRQLSYFQRSKFSTSLWFLARLLFWAKWQSRDFEKVFKLNLDPGIDPRLKIMFGTSLHFLDCSLGQNGNLIWRLQRCVALLWHDKRVRASAARSPRLSALPVGLSEVNQLLCFRGASILI